MKVLKDWVFETFTGDSELIALMGADPRFNPGFALDEEEFPYGVFRFTLQDPGQSGGGSSGWGLYQGWMDLDLWDQGPNSDRMEMIRDRTVRLFSRRFYQDEIPGIRGFRCWLAGDLEDPPNEDRIWHRVLRFGIRFIAAQEIQDVLDR